MIDLDEIEKTARAIDDFDCEAATEECRQQGDWPHCIACNGQYVLDIEHEASALCHGCEHAVSTDLARALLAVLPVVRAAGHLASIDTPRKMSLAANAYRVIEHGRREAALIKAVEEMRALLAEEGK